MNVYMYIYIIYIYRDRQIDRQIDRQMDGYIIYICREREREGERFQLHFSPNKIKAISTILDNSTRFSQATVTKLIVIF